MYREQFVKSVARRELLRNEGLADVIRMVGVRGSLAGDDRNRPLAQGHVVRVVCASRLFLRRPIQRSPRIDVIKLIDHWVETNPSNILICRTDICFADVKYGCLQMLDW
jgi:hypothetical protein